MTRFYSPGQRLLQEHQQTTRIADRLLETRRHSEFTADDRAIIEAAPFFFLATADAEGRPDCSYKGGEPGFVLVTGPGELMFPDYDGNGMFRSLGNIRDNPNVGLLFIQFSGDKRRVRVNGTASILADEPSRRRWPGAVHVVHVAVRDVFPNCPRYIHTMHLESHSEYVPRDGYLPPEAAWKSKPDLKDYVPVRTSSTQGTGDPERSERKE